MAEDAEGGERGERVDFCTLGMFIIGAISVAGKNQFQPTLIETVMHLDSDDIYPPPISPSQTPHLNIIGGAGTYSALGARLFSPPPLSRTIGWIVDAGTDFPSDLYATLSSWNTAMLLRKRGGLTTRGWNGYSGAHDHRAFKYLTPKKRLTADDLPAENLLRARSLHLICSPTRCVEQVARTLERRRESGFRERPLFIWEPVPDLCTPEELDNTLAALCDVDVVSPNHEELSALFGFEHPDSGVDKTVVEKHAAALLAGHIGPEGDGSVVVRAGKEGCYVATLSKQMWLPAYHQDASRVVDPTGGGNGFLGGFAVGLVRCSGDVVEAARWGNVAAALCIEQVGAPTLVVTAGEERWNGISVHERLEEYRTRTS